MRKAVIFGKDGNEGDSVIHAGFATDYNTNDTQELLTNAICEHLGIKYLAEIADGDKWYVDEIKAEADGFYIIDKKLFDVIMSGDVPMPSDGIQYACEGLRKSQIQFAAEKVIKLED